MISSFLFLLIQAGILLGSNTKLQADYPPEITTPSQAQTFKLYLKVDGVDSGPFDQICMIGGTPSVVYCNVSLTSGIIDKLNIVGAHTISANAAFTDSNGNIIHGAESAILNWNHGPAAPLNLKIIISIGD